MTDKTMTFRIGDDHEDVMKETLTEVLQRTQHTSLLITMQEAW